MHYLKHLAAVGTTDIHPGGGAATSLLLQSLALRDGESVLEVGCGTGGTLLRVAHAYNVHAVGIDLMAEMVEVASDRLRWASPEESVSVIQGDAAALPFSPQSFDAVYCESVLGFHGASQVRKMLHEMCRILRPGGRCIANEAIWKQSTNSLEIAHVNAQCESAYGLRQASKEAWILDDWLRTMQEAGFEVRSSQLLRDTIAKRQAPPTRAGSSIKSKLASMFWRLRFVLHPSLIRQQWRYARLLRRHRDFGRLIEARLFVLARPSCFHPQTDLHCLQSIKLEEEIPRSFVGPASAGHPENSDVRLKSNPQNEASIALDKWHGAKGSHPGHS